MTKVKYHFLFLHQYFTEMFSLLMIGVFLNVSNTETNTPHTGAIIMMFILQLIISHLIARYTSLSMIYVMVPVFFIIMIMSGHYFLTALILPAVSCFRLEQLHDSLEHSKAHVSFIIGFAVLLLINLFQFETLYLAPGYFHYIFIAMILFYFIGKLIVLVSDGHYRKQRSAALVFSLSAITIILTALIYTVYTPAMNLIHFIISRFLYGFAAALSPLFDLFEGLELDYPEMEDEETAVEDGSADISIEHSSGTVLNIDTSLVMTVAAVIIITVLVIIYFRKRDALSKSTPEPKKHNIYKESNSVRTKDRQITAPDHRVRKVYFNFEKWLAKHNLGRYHDETIHEWITRLHLTDIISENELTQYIEYRYRDIQLDDDAFHQFKANIKRIKKQLKQR